LHWTNIYLEQESHAALPKSLGLSSQ